MAQKQRQPGSRSTARGKAVAAVLSALGAALILSSAGRGWAHGTVTVPFSMTVDATGSQMSGAPEALGLAGLAGAVAVFAVRRIGRYAVGALLLAAGAGVIATVASKLAHLDSALTDADSRTIVGASAQVTGIGHSFWPYLTMLGGALIALAGAYTLAFGRTWTGLSSRYEPPAASAAAAAGPVPGAEADPAEPTVRDLWDALNRGADPTG
ncbi:MAG TPA: TIGR02234 family membrane protein [Actinocrinis sp.]|nr:TIGR02234 family membrane protein [Actinocrinis sp.]